MKGLLKSKPAWTQFLIFVSITLVSFFVLGLVGHWYYHPFPALASKKWEIYRKWIFPNPAPSLLSVVCSWCSSSVCSSCPLFYVPVCSAQTVNNTSVSENHLIQLILCRHRHHVARYSPDKPVGRT
jgi:hypothetical protein